MKYQYQRTSNIDVRCVCTPPQCPTILQGKIFSLHCLQKNIFGLSKLGGLSSFVSLVSRIEMRYIFLLKTYIASNCSLMTKNNAVKEKRI